MNGIFHFANNLNDEILLFGSKHILFAATVSQYPSLQQFISNIHEEEANSRNYLREKLGILFCILYWLLKNETISIFWLLSTENNGNYMLSTKNPYLDSYNFKYLKQYAHLIKPYWIFNQCFELTQQIRSIWVSYTCFDDAIRAICQHASYIMWHIGTKRFPHI